MGVAKLVVASINQIDCLIQENPSISLALNLPLSTTLLTTLSSDQNDGRPYTTCPIANPFNSFLPSISLIRIKLHWTAHKFDTSTEEH